MSTAVLTQDLQKTYLLWSQLPVPALRGVDLEIVAGEFVAIMGPSGAGKSTLMHILALLDAPTSGKVLLGGRDVSKLSPNQQADFRLRNVGFVFQFFNLFAELSALENAVLPGMVLGHTRAKSEARARALLSEVGLESECYNLGPAELSGGDQQRVAVARALMNEPVLILADEPTANMDSETALDLLGLFRRLNREKGQTVAMVTHEEEWGAKADRVVRIVDGRIV